MPMPVGSVAGWASMEENLPAGDLPGSSDQPGPPSHPLRATMVLLIVAAALLATFVRVPYFVFRPGSVQPLSGKVMVTTGQRFNATGEIHFTTVRQDATVNGWEWLEARMKPSLTLVEEDRILDGRSRDENRAFNMQLMRVSKSTAVAVALRYLGIDPFRPTGVGLAQVQVDGPSTGRLTINDVIVSVDGMPVLEAGDLVIAIRDRSPGEMVDFEVEPVEGGQSRVVSFALQPRPDDPTIGYMGVVPQTRWEDVEDLPIDVRVNTGNVGGNSAGLALTLSILDLITPGELTGGLQVATTGTIDPAGVVGPIGGIIQKVVAARDGGMDLFLVPAQEAGEARRHAGSMTVEGVATLEDALEALARHGGMTRDLRLPTG